MDKNQKQAQSKGKDGNKNTQGVILLSNRFQSKLPVSELLQLEVNSALKSMKIDVNQLHASEKVLDYFETLREELLVLFSLDKFIKDKQEEYDDVKEVIDESEALKQVYLKAKLQNERDIKIQ